MLETGVCGLLGPVKPSAGAVSPFRSVSDLKVHMCMDTTDSWIEGAKRIIQLMFCWPDCRHLGLTQSSSKWWSIKTPRNQRNLMACTQKWMNMAWLPPVSRSKRCSQPVFSSSLLVLSQGVAQTHLKAHGKTATVQPPPHGVYSRRSVPRTCQATVVLRI